MVLFFSFFFFRQIFQKDTCFNLFSNELFDGYTYDQMFSLLFAKYVSVCNSYIADNSTWILSNGTGCTYGCNDCLNNICTCYDKATCDAWKDVAKAILSTLWIILIIICVICGLCIIAGITYCVCAGALCCAAISKSHRGKASFIPEPEETVTETQMA